MTSMSPDEFCAILDYLEISDDVAAVAFGFDGSELQAMKDGSRPVPFLISALTVLMCESPKATQLAIEHGQWVATEEPTLAEVLTNATGAGVMLRAKPRPVLKVVKDGD